MTLSNPFPSLRAVQSLKADIPVSQSVTTTSYPYFWPSSSHSMASALCLHPTSIPPFPTSLDLASPQSCVDHFSHSSAPLALLILWCICLANLRVGIDTHSASPTPQPRELSSAGENHIALQIAATAEVWFFILRPNSLSCWFSSTSQIWDFVLPCLFLLTSLSIYQTMPVKGEGSALPICAPAHHTNPGPKQVSVNVAELN